MAHGVDINTLAAGTGGILKINVKREGQLSWEDPTIINQFKGFASQGSRAIQGNTTVYKASRLGIVQDKSLNLLIWGGGEILNCPQRVRCPRGTPSTISEEELSGHPRNEANRFII
jgi:hypothetical protein